jgi:oxygen-dependent protoporphyrinogen oxidase
VSRAERTSGGWQVTTPAGIERAPLLVVALPLDAAAALLGGPAPEAQPAALDVITLVLDDDLADAPRGTGVLVGANVPGVAAKALTHSTAKWGWLRAAAGGREVLRLSYGRRGLAPVTSVLKPAELTALVRADAAALLGRPISEPLEIRRTGWRTLPPGTPGVAASRDWLTARAGDDLALVGAGIAGVGLAAVVPQARAEAARLLKKQEN